MKAGPVRVSNVVSQGIKCDALVFSCYYIESLSLSLKVLTGLRTYHGLAPISSVGLSKADQNLAEFFFGCLLSLHILLLLPPGTAFCFLGHKSLCLHLPVSLSLQQGS